MSGKISRALNLLNRYQSIIVACSGGVDSGLALKLAVDSGVERVIAVTAEALFTVPGETAVAASWTRSLGIPHYILHTGQMDCPDFTANQRDRCYHCKRILFAAFSELAELHGQAVLVDGTNADDSVRRPGMRALREYGVLSPLREAGLTKTEIREYARLSGIPHWNRPPESCLCTRLPYDQKITPEHLRQVAEAEKFLRDHVGLSIVRVRHHGDIARIETDPAQWSALLGTAAAGVEQHFRRLGFRFITVDLSGYRTGSFD